MTTKEIVEIIKESPLFEMISSQEKYKAITYAIEAAGIEYSNEEIKEIVGEVYPHFH